jgi:hypothetical protein
MATARNPPGTRAKLVKSPLPLKPPDARAELIDLDVEARQLRGEQAYEAHGQSAKTLVKHEHFREVLIALKGGRRCHEHRAEESVSVQALDGDVKVHLASEGAIELHGRSVLVLAPALAHDIEALADSTLLLTLAWTGHRRAARDRRPDAQR